MVFSCKRNRRLFTKMAKGTMKGVKLMFLKSDQETATREKECFKYCMKNDIQKQQENDFKSAAIYLENAIRSLNTLERMKEDKQKKEQYAEWFRHDRDRLNSLQRMYDFYA